MRRLMDIVVSVCGLVLLSPVLTAAGVLVWLQDFCSPLYISSRVGRRERPFRMVKLRTMVVGAEVAGSSSGTDDRRVTAIGRFLRRSKLDEIPQLWNVLAGDMSLVGPRPQVAWAVRDYTAIERRLLEVRPGITDAASIVFADESTLLTGAENPDLRYSQIIRPWKNRIALLYVDRGGLSGYAMLVAATLIHSFSRRGGLMIVRSLLLKWGADRDVISVASRMTSPPEAPPQGALQVVDSVDQRCDGSGAL